MTVLAVDQSFTSCGIVVADGTQLIHCEKFTTDKQKEIYERAWDVSEKLVNVAKQYNVEYIAIEGLAFGKSGDATRDLAGLLFVIVARFRYVEGFDVVIITPNTVKKVATGKGNAKKEQMVEALPPHIRAAFDQLGVKKTTGLLDMSDAWWISQAAQK